jgi:aspartate/methionine/tyrosine aminotransferase
MSILGTETAFEVLAKAKQLEKEGREIIHLEIGEPDFDTPENIIKAACDALNSGYTHYTPSNGLPIVRETVAKEISLTRGIKIDPDEVVMVPGGKPIMFFSIMALIENGDEVIYPNPGFPIYESVINFAGGKPVPIKLKEELNFRMDIAELKNLITDKTKMIIINTPQNPTGSCLTEEDVREIVNLVRKREVFVLSDEIYSRIIYDGIKHASILKYEDIKEKIILLDGFSKTYAMTGWRIGFGVMNKTLASAVTRLMTNSNSCTAAFTQIAAMHALTGPQDDVNKMVSEFKERRNLIVNGLNNIKNISCVMPEGAFYVFPNIKKTGYLSKELSDLILNKTGVAVLSGTAFGSYGEGYIRLSYANSQENIKKALKKIKEFVENL